MRKQDQTFNAIALQHGLQGSDKVTFIELCEAFVQNESDPEAWEKYCNSSEAIQAAVKMFLGRDLNQERPC